MILGAAVRHPPGHDISSVRQGLCAYLGLSQPHIGPPSDTVEYIAHKEDAAALLKYFSGHDTEGVLPDDIEPLDETHSGSQKTQVLEAMEGLSSWEGSCLPRLPFTRSYSERVPHEPVGPLPRVSGCYG